MKKTVYSIFIVASSLIVVSCNNNNDADKAAWAGLVESKTYTLKPDFINDDYWGAVNQNVDYNKIFNTLVDAVLQGRKKAYDILSDRELSENEVRKILATSGTNDGPVNISDLSALRMRESWNFDEKDFSLTKKVSRVDLLLKKIDPTTGEYLGDRALFYVKLNDEE